MEAKKKILVNSLVKNMGNISKSCLECGISRGTYYSWFNLDSEFKEEASNIDEYILDIAESSLINQIKEGNTTAIIFYLKTKGAKRGYIERGITLNSSPIILNLGSGIKPED